MTIQPNKARFLVAVGVSAVVWLAAILYVFGIAYYVPGANGFIRMYPHPLIVMAVTTLMLGITFWMWRWYKMDRVSRALSGLDAEERRQLISQLLQGAEQRLTFNDDGEYDVVLTPKKQKRDEASNN